MGSCDICEGNKKSWAFGGRCEEHDVCLICKTKRKELSDTPWAHRDGIVCRPCQHKEHERIKDAALAAMHKNYDPWDYDSLDLPKCPYCDLEVDHPWDYSWDQSEKEIRCDRCDNSFLVVDQPRVYFTSSRIGEK